MSERRIAGLSSLSEREAEQLAQLAAPYLLPANEKEETVTLDLLAERIDRECRALCSEHSGSARGACSSSSMRRAALAAALGTLMVRELDLEWSACRSLEDADTVEYVVLRPHTDIVFYPERLIARQLRQGAPLPAPELLDSTKRYLASLQRFYPAAI